jgi:hypothetical protein
LTNILGVLGESPERAFFSLSINYISKSFAHTYINCLKIIIIVVVVVVVVVIVF